LGTPLMLGALPGSGTGRPLHASQVVNPCFDIILG